jgi:hypothetical protein
VSTAEAALQARELKTVQNALSRSFSLPSLTWIYHLSYRKDQPEVEPVGGNPDLIMQDSMQLPLVASKAHQAGQLIFALHAT